MSSILTTLKSLLPGVPSQTARDEAYLSGAVDLPDLELRIRALDDRGRSSAYGVSLGLY